MYGQSIRYDQDPTDEPARRCQDLQQCIGLLHEDSKERGTFDPLARFHPYLVTICSYHHHPACDLRAVAWNDGYEVTLSVFVRIGLIFNILGIEIENFL
mmetsp:Transcript_21972/g.32956  ORF Transcript_21972/g.32956 Transcript_21972/m.32956 type:complete len:99 (-) Transcript_21972:48-344(-)